MLCTKIGIAKVQKNARREVKPNLRCAYFRPRSFVEKFLPDIQPGWLEADGRALGTGPSLGFQTVGADFRKYSEKLAIK